MSSEIQNNKCLKCNKNKEGLLFDTEFYCWECLLPLLEKELDESGDWERNKKKLFREAIEKCKKRQSFDWPWRERGEFTDHGATRWDRFSTRCVQCDICLHWDVTPYEDSSKHICSYCANCDKDIEKNKQSEHFTWQETTPVYVCRKMKDSPRRICITCDSAKMLGAGKFKSLMSSLEGNKCFSFTGIRPNAKGHCVLATKEHLKDIRSLDALNWNDILPTLKDTIKKIDTVYNPPGYRIGIPTGKLGTQNGPHFYIRIVPKYKEDYGTMGMSYYYEPPSFEEIKNANEVLQPNAENIIAERSKVIARLHHETSIAYTILSTKQHVPAEIDKMDSETWSQIGEVMQESLQKIEKLNFQDFLISFSLGEASKLFEKEKGETPYSKTKSPYDKKEFKITIFPKSPHTKKRQKWWGREGRPEKDGQPAGTMENERIAEKLRDPEAYYKKWGKSNTYTHTHRERERASYLSENNRVLTY